MSQIHTIVVRYPDGMRPEYCAQSTFQGGKIVAVDFSGDRTGDRTEDRMDIVKELEEALDQALTSMLDSGYSPKAVVIRAGRQALTKARGGA